MSETEPPRSAAGADDALAGGGNGPAGILPTHARARARVDPDGGRLVVELPPIDVPAAPGGHHGQVHEAMIQTPLAVVVVPATGALHGYHVELVDGAGRPLPADMLHHLNVTDLDRRELFLPIQLHILAASKETGSPSIPARLFGLPLQRGQRLLAYAMLHNTDSVAHPGVRVRLILDWVPERGLLRPWPLFPGYPWVMDVMFPFGRPPDGVKAFDLPPGRSSRSWEARPAIPGKIVGVGGHAHDYAVGLELRDATTGEVIWHVVPHRDSTGHVTGIPFGRFYRWNRLGVHITPEHTYRVTVTYDNPTGRVLRDGGMGVVAGLFIPDRGHEWPPADTSNAIYRQELRYTYGGEVGMEIRRRSEAASAGDDESS